MFDSTYFREALKKQAQQAGGHPVVRLRLHNGEEYFVRDVVESKPGYVLLNVHPPNVSAEIVASSSSAYSHVPAGGSHPVAVAYESIADVHLSNTTADQSARIGFHL